MIRSVLAVLIGYLLFAISGAAWFRLSGLDPHSVASPLFILGSILYGVFFSAIGGYVAATLGKRFPTEHSLAVATLIAALGAASLLAEAGKGAVWTQLSVLLIIAPAAMLGGYLRRRQVAATRSRA